MTKNKPPFVSVLKAIRPVEKDGSLVYPNLPPAVSLHKPYDNAREAIFYTAKHGSIDEERAAKELAKSYLLQTVMRLSFSVDETIEEVWADRMTTASMEIYGEPDNKRAKELLTRDYLKIQSIQVPSHLEDEKKELIDMYIRYGAEPEQSFNLDDDEKKTFEDALDNVRLSMLPYLKSRYQQGLEEFEKLPKDSMVYPVEIVEIFNKALAALSGAHPELRGWTAVIQENSDTIYTNDDSNKIEVGANRIGSYSDELAGIFLHEIIAHATRSVLGSLINSNMKKGLPNYLPFEEGLGVATEFALNGSIPDKIADRYIDIAIALGLGGKKVRRSELRNFATMRSKIRKISKYGEALNETDEAGIDTHINRIYRGSKGDKVVGVFTKDISYFEGFEKVVKFIDNALSESRSVEEIMEYLLEGRFDPTEEAHVRYRSDINLRAVL
jgi:hypothetical protein